jgi:probable F420-dependent oxidoreductase
VNLGRFGVWWSGSWRLPDDPDFNVAGDIESLGFGALWSSGGFEVGLADRFRRLLSATEHVTVASGIVSIWAGVADVVGPAALALDLEHEGRFLLGVGASHSAIVPDYARPYSKMVAYLDALDSLHPPVPPERRVLAALRPHMLELAATRAVGAHPYFVPAEHTARAREILGRSPLLAPEVAVVLERDPARARALAREYASIYLGLPNYTGNLRTFGFDDDDVAGGGSDRLIDAVVPWGDVQAVAARLHEHLDAGADHVCIQVVDAHHDFPLAGYRELAAVLFDD